MVLGMVSSFFQEESSENPTCIGGEVFRPVHSLNVSSLFWPLFLLRDFPCDTGRRVCQHSAMKQHVYIGVGSA